MVMWFASYANLVMSQWACASCAHVHGSCAIIKMGTSKYLNGLTGTRADSNLGKLTVSHFNALITQNANKNMPNVFPIVYLNPSFTPTCFGTQQKVRKQCEKPILLYLLVDIIIF